MNGAGIAHVEAINVEVGQHIVWHVFGVALNVDTILGTLVAGLVIVLFGVLLRLRLSVRKPSGVQLFFETVTSQIENQVESTLGIRTAPFVVPLAAALFLFILIANWLAIIPTGHHPEYMPPPASDVNLTYALALLVIVWMHITGVRRQGFKGYYGHLFKPSVAMFPINLVEELAKPLTLSLRLFGNIFSGVIMVSLIALFPAYILWAPELIWKLFDMFIGLIQAFIFALLTIIYFSSVRPDQESAH
ncbi:ATP synthase F0 subcomplex A subunit [Antricoccus suffuscus]|uniref:ATP synthase subunit a n=1 Tax=Antricoccus suffuscus TaxID=1629062 RepID=A0A2T1A066_9ACTN|nr:F0F1 ATP synthase subunit A [Antricoccus suffuscus]PRZ41995.1 ATP synthase F0 subcomplex A subunit [Antricoccus suffuscus]